ncbi:MAG: helix-turn-helix domain-containing protein [Crocinitomicaceae bacterium]|nr:helix-turn-helix domain-containing protein [Crocinitomicaceae bacterium]
MTIYTTPLQFGYFFSLAMWLVFLYRGFNQNRLSDKMLGWVMFILAMELQDYTFGFAGINVLWNELNGFPRDVTLLFGPIIYFYFKSQINRSFTVRRRSLIHFLPYTIYFLYHIFFFVQGPEAVEWRQSSTMDNVLFYILLIGTWVSYIFYFTQCLKIYRRYKRWSLNQFSNLELIGFNWFRNFIYAMIIWLISRQIMNVLDIIFDLDFHQDWWWNLVLVAVTFYIGLAGYSQVQPAQINFNFDELLKDEVKEEAQEIERKDDANHRIDMLAKQLSEVMEKEKLFLNQDLNLQYLSKRLKTNSVELSATINQTFKKNFNDYINALRVEEFIRLSQDEKRSHFTLLSNAYDAGFSSKSTFNRGFKKIKGAAPREYLAKK